MDGITAIGVAVGVLGAINVLELRKIFEISDRTTRLEGKVDVLNSRD